MDYLTLTLIEFLDLITGRKEEYQINIGEDTITGSLSMLSGLIESMDEDSQKLFRPLIADLNKEKQDMELTNIEIYNYFERLTGGFEHSKIEVVLPEVKAYFYQRQEEIRDESIEIITGLNQDLPTKRIELSFKEGKRQQIVTDNDAVVKQTHPLWNTNINYALNLLNKKLTGVENVNTSQNKNRKENSNTTLYPEIFRPGGYELFEYLNQKYTSNDNSKRAKYSNLFRFLEDRQQLTSTQKQYIEFIKNKYNISMSRILPATYKYETKIEPILKTFKWQYEHPDND